MTSLPTALPQPDGLFDAVLRKPFTPDFFSKRWPDVWDMDEGATEWTSLSAQPAGRFLGPPHTVVRVTGRTCSATAAPSAAQKSTPPFIARTPRPRTPGGRPPRLTIFDSRSKFHARLRTTTSSGVSGARSSDSCGKRMAWVASAVRCWSSCRRRLNLTPRSRAGSLNSSVDLRRVPGV